MFRLYYKTGACSLSPHIVLREAGLPFELVKVDTRIGRTKDGADFRLVNPRGYVPALQNEHGQVLTEGPAIVQHLADLVPSKRLAPPAGTWERTRLQEWLNYLSTELHKGISPLFSPIAPEPWKQAVREQYEGKLSWLDGELARGGPFLMGEGFSVADPYLFTILGWLRLVGIDLSRWPALAAFRARMLLRPAVREAMDAEGLKH